jgi:beta-mannan synthase
MDRLSTTSAMLPDAFRGVRDDISGQVGFIWQQAKAPLIVPLLKLAVGVCLVMSVMLFVERVYMGIVIVLVKLFGRRPEKRYKCEPMRDDVELGHLGFPMVLVQIPMYNEKEVCKYSITHLIYFLINYLFFFFFFFFDFKLNPYSKIFEY